jgi:hypothetical protein
MPAAKRVGVSGPEYVAPITLVAPVDQTDAANTARNYRKSLRRGGKKLAWWCLVG